MENLFTLVPRHGYSVIFVIVLAEAMGLPVPAALALVAGGAAIASGTMLAPVAYLVAAGALLLGDSIVYWLGRYMGWRLLGFLCRVSLNPEACILRSSELFYKRGRAALLVAKFIPGINAMAPPLAGSMKMRFDQFLLLDFAGASLYVLAYGCLGYLFHNVIAGLERVFAAAGHILGGTILLALAAYSVFLLWLYRKRRIYRVVPRVQAWELAKKLESGEADNILLVDVRSAGYYDPGAARIKGSIRLEPNDLENEARNLPRGKDIYIYCT